MYQPRLNDDQKITCYTIYAIYYQAIYQSTKVILTY